MLTIFHYANSLFSNLLSTLVPLQRLRKRPMPLSKPSWKKSPRRQPLVRPKLLLVSLRPSTRLPPPFTSMPARSIETFKHTSDFSYINPFFMPYQFVLLAVNICSLRRQQPAAHVVTVYVTEPRNITAT